MACCQGTCPTVDMMRMLVYGFLALMGGAAGWVILSPIMRPVLDFILEYQGQRNEWALRQARQEAGIPDVVAEEVM